MNKNTHGKGKAKGAKISGGYKGGKETHYAGAMKKGSKKPGKGARRGY